MQKTISRTIVLLVCVLACIATMSAQHGSAGAGATPAVSSDQIWSQLEAGNRRFAEGQPGPRDLVARRRQLAKSQQPKAAVLSCSDSRVPPEIVFDQGLGDLFVVRSAGNSADPLAIGSLEYAVEHLGTTVLVVLGHQSCGAVQAACTGGKAATENLEAVVRPVAPSCAAAKAIAGSDLIETAVRDHVHRTAEALLANSPVLKHAHEEGKLTIIEAYYALNTGLVTRLR
jgi:carbonic anhydrase